MPTYESPRITERRALEGSLGGPSDLAPDSDAEIKHSVQPVESYETPQIIEERDLSGSTEFTRSGQG